MSAALDVLAMEGGHPVDVDGVSGREELARCCGEIWLQALAVYYRDCWQSLRGVASADPEALDDLTRDRRLLANLCRPLDADPEVVGDAMAAGLDAGRRWGG
ncbi:hypothetical protein [Halomonas stenophila]|uniref:Uncharacterized protein n=1 Tax=Halomonas stenophila TaxID=795312 RepID=A0A7W5HL10_9GAMM|nr:hypothetical protein [Halomonas stenophila]MBB3231056.1 hypothetical protein [Halomonas stenophila]